MCALVATNSLKVVYMNVYEGINNNQYLLNMCRGMQEPYAAYKMQIYRVCIPYLFASHRPSGPCKRDTLGFCLVFQVV